MKKLVTFILVLILAFGAVSCGDKKNKGGEMADIADISAVVASEKVLADKSSETYDAIKLDEVRIDTVKNEYESGQIMISAKKDLNYSAEASDLVNVNDSSEKIDKENVKLFMEKYMFIPAIYHKNGADTGEYPDALIPHDNAVEYGQNFVKEGQNGVLYIEVYTPKDTEAGVYQGTVTVKIDDAEKSIPIKVVVYDYELSDETTAESVFVITAMSVNEHELDDSQDMYNKYLDLLAKTRVSPSSFAVEAMENEEYTELVKSYLKKGMNSIPTSFGYSVENGYTVFNAELLHNDIILWAKESIKDQVNYVDRINFYNAAIDEPFWASFAPGTVDYNIKRFVEVREQCREELSEFPEFETEFGKEVLSSLDNIRHVITDYIDNDYQGSGGHRYDNSNPPILNADGTLFEYYGKDVVLCPRFDAFDTEEDFENYRRQAGEFDNEVWFYGCNFPNYPYPSYHIEDTLTSTMSVGWMMADYDIAGNLYWSINCHLNLGGTLIEDAYTIPQRGSGANGEGAIVYPGKPYGVDGPISSIRMEAVREGNEDYELLKDLKEIYAEKGADAKGILKYLTEDIYDMASVIGGSNEYENSRKILLKALEAASGDTGLMITEYEKTMSQEHGEVYAARVKVSSDTDLYYNGEKLSSVGNNEYKVLLKAEKDINAMSFKAVNGDVTAELELFMSGKQVVADKKDYTEKTFTSKGDILAQALKNGWYDISLVNKEKASVVIKNAIFDELSGDTDKLVIYINNPHAEQKKFTVFVTYDKEGKYRYNTGSLNSGENLIELTFFKDANWSKLGKVVSVELSFENMDSVGFGNFILFNK